MKRSRSLPPEEFAYLTAKLKELDLVQRTDSLGSGRWVEYHEKSHMHLKSEQEICLCKNVPSRYKKWHLPFGWHTTFQDSFVMSYKQQEKALKNDQQLSIPSKAFRLQNMLLCDHHFPFRPLPHKNAESQTRKSFIYCHFGSLAEAKSQQFRRSLQAWKKVPFSAKI